MPRWSRFKKGSVRGRDCEGRRRLGGGGFLCWLCIIGIATGAQANIVRVPADQPTIQAGIDAASSGDIVLVAPGIYIGSGNKNLSLGAKDLEIRSEAGSEATIIDCEGSGRGFLLSGLLTEATIVEGFTIRNGNVEGDPVGGGAIFIAAGAPSISNCTFERNRADGLLQNGGGGAISVYNARPTIADCRFVENSATGSATIGGALGIHHSSILVRGCVFERNVVTPTSGGGGGIGIVSAVADTAEFTAIIQDCEFSGNEASLGGGAFVVRSRVVRCRFNDNRAEEGGGMSALGCEIADCEVVENEASQFAGGVDLSACIMERCLVVDNSAAEGGGVRDSGFESTLSNCIIARNSANRGGGYIGVGRAARLVNCTIADNDAAVASGVYLFSAEHEVWLFERTIISGGHTGAAIQCEFNANAMLFCTDVFGNADGDWVDCISGQENLAGNLSVDPLYCQVEIEWHLCGDSPCAPEQTGACGLIGALPVGCGDCGPQPLDPSTWGQIKYQVPRRFGSAPKNSE